MLIRRIVLPPFALVALLVAACSSGAGASDGGSSDALERNVSTPEQAYQRLANLDAKFARLERKNPDMIGQCCWYEAVPTDTGFEVLIHIGWGDCPSGCIHKHEWTYTVGRDGTATLLRETGDPMPPGGVPAGSGDI